MEEIEKRFPLWSKVKYIGWDQEDWAGEYTVVRYEPGTVITVSQNGVRLGFKPDSLRLANQQVEVIIDLMQWF